MARCRRSRHHTVLQGLAHAPDAADVGCRNSWQARPNSVALAASMASCSVLNLNTGARGQGFLACAQHVGAGVGHHRPVQKLGRALSWPHAATCEHAAAFGYGVLHMAFDFCKAASSISGPWLTPSSKPLPTLAVLYLGGKLVHKLLITPSLVHRCGWSTHAGLYVAVFAGKGAFNCAVDVGVVKHDKGALPPSSNDIF